MKRLLIFINEENVKRFIDIFLNHGKIPAFPQIIAYHFKIMGNFSNLEALDVLLKYRRGYNCGLSSRFRKRYFSDINEILKRRNDTGIRWIERERQSMAFHESFEFLGVDTVRYEVSEVEGIKTINEAYDRKLDVPTLEIRDIREKAMESVIKDNIDRIKEEKKKRKLELYRDVFHKLKVKDIENKRVKREFQISELRKLIKDKGGKMVDMTKAEREKVKEMSPYYGLREEDVLKEKELKYVRYAVSERRRMAEITNKKYITEMPTEWEYIEEPGFRMESEVNDKHGKIQTILGAISVMKSYYRPNERVVKAFEDMDKAEKEVSRRCRLIFEEPDNAVKAARGVGYEIDMEEIKADLRSQGVKDKIDLYKRDIKKHVQEFNKVLEEEKYYSPEQQDIIITRDYFYKPRKEWLNSLKERLVETKAKYEEQEADRIKNIGKRVQLAEVVIDLDRIKKSDIKFDERIIKDLEEELEEVKKDLNKRISEINVINNSTGKIVIKNRLSMIKEVDEGMTKNTVGEKLESLYNLVERSQQQINTCRQRDPQLESFIVNLYKKEYENWKRMIECKAKYGAEGRIRNVGDNPTFFLLTYDKMVERRKYIFSGKRRIISYDNLCMSQAEKDEADEIIKLLKEKEGDYLSAQQNLLKTNPEICDYKDIQMRKNYSRSVGMDWDMAEKEWVKEYVRRNLENAEKVVCEYKILIDRYKMLFGVNPFGVIIGSKGKTKEEDKKRSKDLRVSTNDKLRQTLINEVVNRDFSEVQIDEFAEETLYVCGYQGAEVNHRSNINQLREVIEKNKKEKKNELARLQFEKLTLIEHLYNVINNDKSAPYMKDVTNEKIEEWDTDEKSRVEQEIKESSIKNKSKGGNKEIKSNPGLIITRGKKMERELTQKKILSKKRADEIYQRVKDISDKKGTSILSKNRYKVGNEKELMKIVGEYVDSRFAKDTLLYEVKNHTKAVKYYEKKRVTVQESIKNGLTKDEIVKVKNNFDIENNSNANKKYCVTATKEYIKVLMMMRLTGVNEIKEVRELFGFKRNQSKYMKERLEEKWNEEVRTLRNTMSKGGETNIAKSGKAGGSKTESDTNPKRKPIGLRRGFL